MMLTSMLRQIIGVTMFLQNKNLTLVNNRFGLETIMQFSANENQMEL